MTVHNHGPSQGKGLACRERRTGDGRLVGECIAPIPPTISPSGEAVPDHDAAMRIADSWDFSLESEGGVGEPPDIYVLARAYKAVVRDALTPEEALFVLKEVEKLPVKGTELDQWMEVRPVYQAKLRRIAARAATEKQECVRQFHENISNEDDPHYDEDAAVCAKCSHTFRDHCGRAFNYQCASSGCPCDGFQGSRAATTKEGER